MDDLGLGLFWIGFIAAVFFGWYFYIKARNKERMALIERDKDVSEIYSKKEIRFKMPWLKIGLFVTGLGFGLALAIFLLALPLFKNELNGDMAAIFPVSSMFFFGGLGIVLGHYLEKRTK